MTLDGLFNEKFASKIFCTQRKAIKNTHNFALKEKFPEHKGVHFFVHDYQFERVWNRPDRYTDVLSKFAYVLSPDFSPYANSPKAIQIFNIYRKNWCARYWQGRIVLLCC